MGHRISSAYHPQTNGLDERMNQTLKSTLVKFVNDNQNDWDVHLKAVLFAYRPSKNDSTKFTLFELMFGHAPVLPIEVKIKSKPEGEAPEVNPVTDTDEDMEEKVNSMISIWNQIKAQAMKNVEKAQERQKKAYDAKYQRNHSRYYYFTVKNKLFSRDPFILKNWKLPNQDELRDIIIKRLYLKLILNLYLIR